MARLRTILGGSGAIVAALALFYYSWDGTPVEGYEPTAIYPPRRDPLVINLAKATPPADRHANGQLDESIADLKNRGGVMIDPQSLPQETRRAISQALEPIFGSPAAPRCGELDEARLARGSKVFKLQCTQCHGMAGDGRGPNSPWVFPPARDFRQGQFKFVSTTDGLGWPTLPDLRNLIRRGLGASIMPPFELFSDADLDAVSHYVLHLMFRGLIEYDLIAACASDDPPDDLNHFAQARFRKWFGQWKQSQSSSVDPQLQFRVQDGGTDPAYDDSIRRGHVLFSSEANACLKCHVNYGRDVAWRYDVWGVAVKPANLTLGNHRGGSEPGDLFKRIRGGIPAVGMPAASNLKDDEIADLVKFLKALPDPRHLPPDLRHSIYPEAAR